MRVKDNNRIVVVCRVINHESIHVFRVMRLNEYLFGEAFFFRIAKAVSSVGFLVRSEGLMSLSIVNNRMMSQIIRVVVYESPFPILRFTLESCTSVTRQGVNE